MNNCPDVCNVTYTVTSAAVAISKCLDNDDLNFLSAVLVQLGDTLATIAATREKCCDNDIADDVQDADDDYSCG